ncbi:unnamed protein product [Sphagnum jensenii]|uniref:Uncharacterized protein n=1 Tax=Sphagnum jensenii TaxID=128206 RepID=A0ABP1AW69_9BRYO
MVKMKIHSELEDAQISKLNECFLVADRIQKARRSSRQGFGKCKSKPNPNGGDVRPSVPSNSGISLFDNDPLSLVIPPVQSFLKAPLMLSFFLSGTSLGKEEKKGIRASEAPAAPRNPERCQTPIQIAQRSSERSDGGAFEGSPQRSPPEITIADTPDQATSGVDETTSRPPPPQKNLKEESEHSRNGPPYKPNSERALGQRIRKNLSSRGGIQGPSPVDYSIELEANFPKEMVIEMQVNVAKKA